jgi:colanic acid/amylovoran/stewartan biosynthesis glycosyltransferase WcaL/AmsK/CpsK
MLIYIFAEHYPTPYKPQFDSEFAYFIRQGHEIKIFAAGRYTSTIHPRVQSYGLDKKTSLFPTTLKTLPRFFGPLCYRLIRSPKMCLRRIFSVYDSNQPLKKKFLRFARVLTLPEATPELCYIHNIATADAIDFLRLIYPSSRVVMYFHGGEVGGVKRVVRDSQLFNLMDVIFTNTNFSRNQAIERGCPPERVIAVPVGFDLSDYPSDSPRSYRKDGLLQLVSVGRLSEEKGLIFALDAVSELVSQGCQSIRYSIVGRGMQEEYLRDYVRSKGLDNYVEFVGERDKSGVVKVLEQSDVLILPSIVTDTWAETQGAVIQEAMFMRLMVIVTQAGGAPESTADVMQQFSVPVCDAYAIAKMIRAIMALSDTEMSRLGDAARVFAVERFSIDRVGRRLLDHAMDNTIASAGETEKTVSK